MTATDSKKKMDGPTELTSISQMMGSGAAGTSIALDSNEDSEKQKSSDASSSLSLTSGVPGGGLHQLSSFDSNLESGNKGNSDSFNPEDKHHHTESVWHSQSSPFAQQSHHHSHIKTGNPVKLVKELAALNRGEDVRDDKGVQDGRPAETEAADRRTARALSRAASASAAATAVGGGVVQPQVISPSTSSGDTSKALQIKLTINKEHTIDGSGREVEFVFVPGSDKCEVRNCGFQNHIL